MSLSGEAEREKPEECDGMHALGASIKIELQLDQQFTELPAGNQYRVRKNCVRKGPRWKRGGACRVAGGTRHRRYGYKQFGGIIKYGRRILLGKTNH